MSLINCTGCGGYHQRPGGSRCKNLHFPRNMGTQYHGEEMPVLVLGLPAPTPKLHGLPFCNLENSPLCPHEMILNTFLYVRRS